MMTMHLPELQLNTKKLLNKKIRPLNGGNLAPSIKSSNMYNISQMFKEMKMPYTRLHDAPLECSGWNIVDIENIFPLFHLDSSDPRNYSFAQTDEYIANCIELGTQIYYRLGPSIEHHIPRYRARAIPREEWDKWAEISCNIIRHYNEGWNNGFHYNIRYWEIWNEPEGLWYGPISEFNDFYCHVAKIIKAAFPDLMVGGPAHVRIEQEGYTGPFLRRVKELNAPLDFYSWHCYTDNVEFMREQVFFAREVVDSYGFPDAELHLNEWHYVPGSWSKGDPLKKPFKYDYTMKGSDCAAFLAATLTVWQDTPLDMACYYTATATYFGLFTASFGVPTKSYWAMRAFGEMLAYPERMELLSNDKDVYALAGKNGKGEIALLISAFHIRGNSVYMHTDVPVESIEELIINEDSDFETVSPKIGKDQIEIPIGSKPGVAFVKLKTVR